jgi:hypothetical protein
MKLRIAGTFTGGCQCGAVRYGATQRFDDAHICHCRMCQKAVGGFFAALVGLPDDAFTWTRGTPSAFMSSDTTERGFCANCGTPLYCRYIDDDYSDINIATLDEPDAVAPQRQIGNESRIACLDSLHALPGRESTTETSMPDMAKTIAASNHQHPDKATENWTPVPKVR